MHYLLSYYVGILYSNTSMCHVCVVKKSVMDRALMELHSFAQKCLMLLYRGCWKGIEPHCHRRTGQHPFGGSNRVLPEWPSQIVFHSAMPERKNK